MCFLTMYDKAWKRRGNTEYIIRCLPDALSQVLVQYLVYVSPFTIQILTASVECTMPIVHFILYKAELGGEKAPRHSANIKC